MLPTRFKAEFSCPESWLVTEPNPKVTVLSALPSKSLIWTSLRMVVPLQRRHHQYALAFIEFASGRR